MINTLASPSEIYGLGPGEAARRGAEQGVAWRGARTTAGLEGLGSGLWEGYQFSRAKGPLGERSSLSTEAGTPLRRYEWACLHLRVRA